MKKFVFGLQTLEGAIEDKLRDMTIDERIQLAMGIGSDKNTEYGSKTRSLPNIATYVLDTNELKTIPLPVYITEEGVPNAAIRDEKWLPYVIGGTSYMLAVASDGVFIREVRHWGKDLGTYIREILSMKFESYNFFSDENPTQDIMKTALKYFLNGVTVNSRLSPLIVVDKQYTDTVLQEIEAHGLKKIQ